MPKDFAKRGRKGQSATPLDDQPAGTKVPGWIYLVVGLLLGLGISFYDDVAALISGTKESVKPVQTTESQPSAKTRYQAVPTEEVEKDDFSFHNVLPNKVVDVPGSPEDQVIRKPAEDKQYIMQCGSFRKAESADTLKAQIALSGFDSTIKATDEKDGARWYRVVLGPYSSKRLAERDRHQLERNNINYCRIW